MSDADSQHDPEKDFRESIQYTLGKFLIEAAEAGYTNIVKELVDKGADVNAESATSSNSPLSAAIYGNHTDIALFLLDKGAHISKTEISIQDVLGKAAAAGHIKMIEAMIARGASVNAGSPDEYWSPLSIAAFHGKVEAASALIRNGADIKWKNQYGQTALHHAASEGCPELVRFLVSNGADINAHDNYGDTPLHEAAKEMRPQTLKVLLELGADKESRNKKRETPLHVAVDKFSPYNGGLWVDNALCATRFLLEAGAKVNVKTREGYTPLDLQLKDERPGAYVIALLQHYGAKKGPKIAFLSAAAQSALSEIRDNKAEMIEVATQLQPPGDSRTMRVCECI